MDPQGSRQTGPQNTQQHSLEKDMSGVKLRWIALAGKLKIRCNDTILSLAYAHQGIYELTDIMLYRPLPKILTTATPWFSSLTTTEYSDWLPLFSTAFSTDSDVPIGTQHTYAVLSCFKAMNHS